MDMDREPLAINPGHSLGFMTLGASLQGVLSTIKAKAHIYTATEICYSQAAPLAVPVIVNLPKNGVRLRFDGPEQRLRCIELVDFTRADVAYKGTELSRHRESDNNATGPTFRRVYQTFGATFPGEYVPPRKGEYSGTYLLSWPGIAFSFPMQHSAWSPSKDHVSLLGSQAAGPASHMVVYEGKTWPQACAKLFDYEPSLPRNLNAAARPKDPFPHDIESVIIRNRHLTLKRTVPAQDYILILNQTSPQDLISELGPPDALHRREVAATRAEPHGHKRSDSTSKPDFRRPPSGSAPSSYSSSTTDTYETDFESDIRDEDPLERAARENFWCYFGHGMDILVAPAPTQTGNTNASSIGNTSNTQLVVTKVVLHGNIPGTYAFNRHRRVRWKLVLDRCTVDSEAHFEHVVKLALLEQHAGATAEAEMTRGKVVNRSWGAMSEDSTFFLPDAGTELVEGNGSEQWLGNTRLYHFPGLAVEVAENGCVTAVTVH